MECFGIIIAIVVGLTVYVASRQPQTGRPPRLESPSSQVDPSGLNGLFTLFLLDRWLDGGEHEMNAGPGDQPDALDEDNDCCWDDSGEEN